MTALPIDGRRRNPPVLQRSVSTKPRGNGLVFQAVDPGGNAACFLGRLLLAGNGSTEFAPPLLGFGWELHSHDLVAGVDVEHLACDRSGAVAREEDTCRAELGGFDIAFERSVLFVVF